MSKARDDVTGTVAELAREQSQVLDLVKQEKERAKEPKKERQQAEKATATSDDEPIKTPAKPSVVPRERRKRAPANVQAIANDPWVNHTFKVRDTKRDRLNKLSLRRKLAGLEPNQVQDMLDIALDYVFNTYEAETKKAANQ